MFKKKHQSVPFALHGDSGIKRSVSFRSTVHSVPFRFDPDSIYFAENLAIPRPVALIPPAAIFAIYRPV